ncbi:hypothetical protein M5D96_002236 [Drosophila gunungcola]|uniref:Uncharacterized protein n=1 Tax=Drosophila gunungcola TaxID=103775 RepID=A0A9P9YZM7_9MUSC|nr:hypothetical protein M5D96_002236 [Drosophila gunungcola]
MAGPSSSSSDCLDNCWANSSWSNKSKHSSQLKGIEGGYLAPAATQTSIHHTHTHNNRRRHCWLLLLLPLLWVIAGMAGVAVGALPLPLALLPSMPQRV